MTGQKILIVNLTRLGDLLQTSPTIASLRESDPAAEITLLVDKNFSEVCAGIPGVSRTIETDLDELGKCVLDGGRELLRAFESARALVEELREGRFDLALNYSSSRMSAVFMGLLRIPEVRGWCATPEGQRQISHPWSRLFATLCLNREMSDLNLVDHYRSIAGGNPGPQALLFETTTEARERARSLLGGVSQGRRLVAMQLGASRENRMWPRESFAQVGRDLQETNCHVVLVGGGRERELASAVRAEIGEHSTDLCGRTDIATLAAVLERSQLLVTGDTGPMHLAAAVGTPIVGLFFGPALPYDTGPYGVDHVLLHAAVECAPCAHSVTCLDAFCRREITPERVSIAARARLAGDWATLDELGSQPGSVRLFRTGFDSNGYFECRRLGGGPPPTEEVLRRAYRAVWLASLSDRPLPREGFADGVDTTPFASIVSMARRGLETAGRLETATRGGDGDLAEIQALGRTLAEVDANLAHVASVEPTVRPLTQLFRFEQESLAPGSVAALARAHRGIYGQLEFQANAMAAMLSPANVMEDSYASANQRG